MDPISDKVKEYLSRKLEECKQNLIKQKRKRQKIKALFVTMILLSILASGVVSVMSMISSVPVIIVPILAAFSGILTAISLQFNLKYKKAGIKPLIDKHKKTSIKT
jgi:hypothetical protein